MSLSDAGCRRQKRCVCVHLLAFNDWCGVLQRHCPTLTAGSISSVKTDYSQVHTRICMYMYMHIDIYVNAHGSVNCTDRICLVSFNICQNPPFTHYPSLLTASLAACCIAHAAQLLAPLKSMEGRLSFEALIGDESARESAAGFTLFAQLQHGTTLVHKCTRMCAYDAKCRQSPRHVHEHSKGGKV